jgi:hypothetical protein
VSQIPSNLPPVPANPFKGIADAPKLTPLGPAPIISADPSAYSGERVELSQQPAAPSAAKKVARTGASSSPRKTSKGVAPKPRIVSTTDNFGRICTGSLHGPLLMEDTTFGLMEPAAPPGYTSQSFRYDNVHDFQTVKAAGMALGTLTPQKLHASPKRSTKIQVPGAGPAFAYKGVKDGQAVLVQHYPRGGPKLASDLPSRGAVELPDGQTALISRTKKRGGSDVEIRFPQSVVDPMAEWGRTLLAIA